MCFLYLTWHELLQGISFRCKRVCPVFKRIWVDFGKWEKDIYGGCKGYPDQEEQKIEVLADLQ